MQATAWFNRYLKSGKESDFLRGLDAWNLSVSSVCRFTDLRDGLVKVRWAESVRPHASNAGLKIEPPLIPDLLWSHAEGKAMWEAFQMAYSRYSKEHFEKIDLYS
jgi:hypothetical protein